MNEYRIDLIDQNGIPQKDHIYANSTQEAADKIRKDWKNCYILRISMTLHDWE